MGDTMMLIINPMAGKGGFKDNISDVLETLCMAGATVTVYMTKYSGHATELVRDNGAKYDTVVCCGGDGTLSETISGLMELEKRPRLGYIPMGTANDVASTLQIPNKPQEAAEIIMRGHTIPFDVGNMDGNYFTYICAFGAFTEVSYETPTESKQTLGHLAYVLEGLGHLGSITPEQLIVEYDDGEIEGDFIFGAVTNTTSIAGLVKLDDGIVSLGDGKFEVILINNPKNIIDLNVIVMGILSQNYNPDYVKLIKTSKVKFTFDKEVKWTRDGEDGGAYKEIVIENIMAPISFIVPEDISTALSEIDS